MRKTIFTATPREVPPKPTQTLFRVKARDLRKGDVLFDPAEMPFSPLRWKVIDFPPDPRGRVVKVCWRVKRVWPLLETTVGVMAIPIDSMVTVERT